MELKRSIDDSTINKPSISQFSLHLLLVFIPSSISLRLVIYVDQKKKDGLRLSSDRDGVVGFSSDLQST